MYFLIRKLYIYLSYLSYTAKNGIHKYAISASQMIHLDNVNETFKHQKQYVSYVYHTLQMRKNPFFLDVSQKMNIFTTIKLTKDNNKPNYLY